MGGRVVSGVSSPPLEREYRTSENLGKSRKKEKIHKENRRCTSADRRCHHAQNVYHSIEPEEEGTLATVRDRAYLTEPDYRRRLDGICDPRPEEE